MIDENKPIEEELDNNSNFNIDTYNSDNSSIDEQFLSDELKTNTDETIEVKDKKKGSKKTIIIATVFSILFALTGAVAGYMLYNMFKDKSSTISVAQGETTTLDEIAKIKAAIENNNVETTYKKTPYKLINYSLDLEANSPYSLVVGKGAATAMGVTQNIESATYRTPTEIFNQNVSSSSMVQTANRYYDKKDGQVTSYECKNKSDWPTATSSSVTYDDYITKFGKLLSGIYYCTKDESRSPITDKFLTLDTTVFEDYKKTTDSTAFQVNSILIYTLSSSTLKSNSIEKTNYGYKITLALNKKGESYYAVQMQSTGGLKSTPPFSYNQLTFNLDENLYLISSEFKDTYVADIGLMSVTTEQTLTQYYYRGETSNLGGVDVTIPNISETEFNGLSLFKE